MTFAEVLLGHLHGSRALAVVGPEQQWTGQELLARAGGAAEWFEAERLPVGTALPALMDSTASALAHALAGALTGRPLAPLNTRTTAAEVTSTVAALGGEALLCDAASLALATETGARLDRRVLVIPDPASRPRAWDVGAGEVAAVLHTSGTTGSPKAVPLHSEPLLARAEAYAVPSGLGHGDLFCTAAPMHHTAGFGMALVAWLLGAGVATLPRFTVDAWGWVQQVRPTHVLLVPSMIEVLLTAGELDAGMHTVIYGASPIHPDTLGAMVRALPSARIVQIFGQTEVSPVTALTHEDHLLALAGEPGLLTSVGRPLPGVELRIEHPDVTGAGELTVRARHAFQPDPDGWHRMGDLGRQDARGYVHLVGRRGDMVIRGGENVYPIEVERVLMSHQGVREVAVVSSPDRRLGEVLRAVVVAVDPASPPGVEELRRHTRAVLPGFKVPELWDFTDALPRNASGKVLRRLL